MDDSQRFSDMTRIFIVRIWREGREDPFLKPVWRGSIEDVSTRERRYFKSKEELVDYLTQKMTGIGLLFE